MFKKAAHIILIGLLLFSTGGVTITRHYCGGALVQTSLYGTPESCCDRNCPYCHNEKISLRVTDQFESASHFVAFTAAFTTLLQQHSLPVQLAFSAISQAGFAEDDTGGRLVKPRQDHCAFPETSPPVLQVFLI